jgi:hypothetical protein
LASGRFAERAQPDPFNEPESRKLTPLFRQWYDYAGQILQIARVAKSKGQAVLGMPDFTRAYNRSKIMVEDFDGLVESMKRIPEGRSAGQPLRETDELSGHDGARRRMTIWVDCHLPSLPQSGERFWALPPTLAGGADRRAPLSRPDKFLKQN